MRCRILSRVLPAIAVACLALAWAVPAPSAQTPPSRDILTIHWGPEDFPGATVLDAEIRRALVSDPDVLVNYHAEYLESETFPAEAASLALRDYIRQKFADRRIDLVIAHTTPSLTFTLRFRDELFPGVPVVFVAGSLPDAIRERSAAGLTGVVSDVSWAETLELALSLHPSVRQVFVVAEAPTVPDYSERIHRALREFSDRVQITYIHEKTLPALLAAIRGIPAQSVLLFTRYVSVTPNRIVYSDEIARLIADASPAPVYVTTELYMGTGVVGGMLRTTRATGGRLGDMARLILEGTRPEDIPVETIRLEPIFDWRQVQRWGIDPSKLPAGSNIQFRTPTAWETYRWAIVGAIVVFLSQLLLIAGLLTHRASRRRAEDTIRAREATLRVSYQRIRHMAGRLINAQERARAGLARDLHDDLCQKLVYVAMGVNSLKSSSAHIQDPETQELLTELETDTNRVFDGIRRLSHDLHPATLRLLGLGPALKAHCNEVSKRHHVEATFAAEGDLGHVHPDVAVCFFRIAQESIRNGLVHGRAKRFTVSLGRADGYVQLSVADDGRGFDLEGVRRDSRGLGLVSMEERAHVVGGDVSIVTAPSQGTTITVRAPAELLHSAPLPDDGFDSELAANERDPAVSSPS
jgi:signal transduction histidine kinase